jgi:hypothetical protein
MREMTGLWHPGTATTVREREMKAPRKGFTEAQARDVAMAIGLDLEASEFDVESFRAGMEIELEHGRRDPQTDVTDDDPEATGRIAWAHLKEFPDYYERLELVERMGPVDSMVGP